jgi:hypothetical protein
MAGAEYPNRADLGKMRAMLRTQLRLALALALFSLLGASCGGGGDQTTKFVGPWTFASGSLTPSCLIAANLPNFNLTGQNVTFTKVDDSTLSLMLNAGCVIKFHASGNSATVVAGQMCTLDLGPPLGMQSISITTWTLSLVGEHIDNTIVGTASVCTAMGTAVLVRGTTDAGARDSGRETGTTGGAGAGGTSGSDGGGAGAGGASGSDGSAGGGGAGGSDAGASEVGAGDGGGADAAAAAGGDAASEAASDGAGSDSD